MELYERLAQLQQEGRAVALITVIRSEGSVPRHEGTKMLVHPDGQVEGTVGGGEMESKVIEAAQRALEGGRLERLSYSFRDPEQGDVGVCGGEMEVLVEPVKPPDKLIVVGGGHVGQAVAHLASWLDFEVVVYDDREEFASEEMVPDADQYVSAALAELPERVPVHDRTYILLTTRGVDIDVEALPPLLDSPAAYLGVIGSRRRWETTAEKLLERGVPAEKIERVTSPMGLELNAETPKEIAVSMLAEIIMLRRGGTGEPMAHKPVTERKSAGG